MILIIDKFTVIRAWNDMLKADPENFIEVELDDYEDIAFMDGDLRCSTDGHVVATEVWDARGCRWRLQGRAADKAREKYPTFTGYATFRAISVVCKLKFRDAQDVG